MEIAYGPITITGDVQGDLHEALAKITSALEDVMPDEHDYYYRSTSFRIKIEIVD